MVALSACDDAVRSNGLGTEIPGGAGWGTSGTGPVAGSGGVAGSGSGGVAGSAAAEAGGVSGAEAGGASGSAGAPASETAGSAGTPASEPDPPGAVESDPDPSDAGADAAIGVGADAGTTPAELEAIHYYGRWNRLAESAITVNSGSHVVARFSGTALTARFDVSLNQAPSPTMTWRIDNGEWLEAELAPAMPLAVDLPPGIHEVVLMVRGLNEGQNRWNAPLVSSITFSGFEVSGGMLEPSPRPKRPRMEFLGDSITEGVALWSSRNGQNTPCWRADARRAYPSLTAQALEAEWRQVGFGRQGLLIGGNGGVPIAGEAFNFFYAGVPRDDWQPDWVVINQGTNDGGASPNDFAPAYADFLSTVRAGYPAAKIVVMRPFNGAHAAEISAAVSTRRNEGDALIEYVDTTGWLSNSDFTDGVHPNEQGSQRAANELASALTALGWP